jgi:hypothetical protein
MSRALLPSIRYGKSQFCPCFNHVGATPELKGRGSLEAAKLLGVSTPIWCARGIPHLDQLEVTGEPTRTEAPEPRSRELILLNVCCCIFSHYARAESNLELIEDTGSGTTVDRGDSKLCCCWNWFSMAALRVGEKAEPPWSAYRGE